MTNATFISLCGERTILPGLALENDAIRPALAERNDDLVIQLLDSEF